MLKKNISVWIARFGNYFFAGLIVSAPLAITVYIAFSLIHWIDSWVKPYLPEKYNPDSYLPFSLPGFGLILVVVLLTLIGFLAANFIGRAILALGEHFMHKTPLVRVLYKTLKHIFETMLSSNNDHFRKVGLMEYPRKGVWSLVLLTGETSLKLENKVKSLDLTQEDDPLVSVFMPCTPNPTTGFLMYVRKSEIVLLDMSVEDVIKLVVSAGILVPERTPSSDSSP